MNAKDVLKELEEKIGKSQARVNFYFAKEIGFDNLADDFKGWAEIERIIDRYQIIGFDENTDFFDLREKCLRKMMRFATEINDFLYIYSLEDRYDHADVGKFKYEAEGKIKKLAGKSLKKWIIVYNHIESTHEINREIQLGGKAWERIFQLARSTRDFNYILKNLKQDPEQDKHTDILREILDKATNTEQCLWVLSQIKKFKNNNHSLYVNFKDAINVKIVRLLGRNKGGDCDD